MTPKESREWWDELFACLIVVALFIFTLIVFATIHSDVAKKELVKAKIEQCPPRNLLGRCPDCHLEK